MSTISVRLHQVRPTTAEVTIRDHKLLIDRPESKGGGNWGAMGGELLLASLGGCFMSNLFEVVRSREAPVQKIQTTVTGTLEGTPPRFTAIELHVTADYPDEAEFQKFVTISERACIVANTLKPAVAITIQIEKR
ncbi:MAG: OsmC family protein [Litorilinea sp.]